MTGHVKHHEVGIKALVIDADFFKYDGIKLGPKHQDIILDMYEALVDFVDTNDYPADGYQMAVIIARAVILGNRLRKGQVAISFDHEQNHLRCGVINCD